MRTSAIPTCIAAVLLAAFGTPLSVSAQVAPPPQAGNPPLVRRLSVNEAVRLAAENNLGIQLARYEPQLEDLNIAQVRANYVPSFSSTFQSVSRTQPNQNFLQGAVTSSDDQFVSNHGITATLPWGGTYDVGWDSSK